MSRATGQYVCNRSGDFPDCVECRHAIGHVPEPILDIDDAFKHLDECCTDYPETGFEVWCGTIYRAHNGRREPVICVTQMEEVEEVVEKEKVRV